MRHRILAPAAALLLCVLLAGCLPVEGSAPETLKAVPYSFAGAADDFAVTYEVRQITEEEYEMLPEERRNQMGLGESYTVLCRVRYTGDRTISYFTYVFGKDTKWEKTSSLGVNTGKEEEFTAALDGVHVLDANVYTGDGMIGGPLPPPQESYLFVITAETLEGEDITCEVTLDPVGENGGSGEAAS